MNAGDLVGKFVVVYVIGGGVEHPTVMQVNQTEDIAGRLFLSGSQPKKLMGLPNWLSHVETHIAWDNVVQFHVFDNYKAYQKAITNQQDGGFFNRFKK